MEPLKPVVRSALLLERAHAAPDDVEEYERLLASQFHEDPDLPAAPAVIGQRDAREARLRELYEQLYAPLDSDSES